MFSSKSRKCLVRVAVGGRSPHMALVGLTSAKEVTQSQSRERMAQV